METTLSTGHGLTAADVMSRCWALPRAGENKLRQMVTHQLEADLPVPLEEMTWGYRRAAGASDGECVVLAQATIECVVDRSEQTPKVLYWLESAP